MKLKKEIKKIKNEESVIKIDKEIIKNSLYNTLNIGIISIFNFLISVVISRSFNKPMFGSYLLIISIFTSLSIFSIPGLKTLIYKTSSRNLDGTYKKSIHLSFYSSFISSVSLILFGVYFIFFNESFYHKEMGISLIIISIFAPFYFSLDFWDLFFRGKERFNICFISNLFILYTSLKSIFNIIITKYSFRYIKSNDLEENWKIKGFKLTIMDVSSIIYNFLDSIIIGLLLPLELLAIYGLTLSITNAIVSILLASIQVFIPRIYKSSKDISRKSLLILFISGFIISFLLGFVIQYPILIFYGSKYIEVIFYTKIFLYVLPFSILSAFMGPYLVKYNMLKEINISKIITISSTIILYIVTIPILGLIGAVFSSIGFFLIQDIIMFIYLKNNNRI
ncbi:MAG: oligosaccharide flippase family protein [Candidatus Lokiarchaeota archaeon]